MRLHHPAIGFDFIAQVAENLRGMAGLVIAVGFRQGGDIAYHQVAAETMLLFGCGVMRNLAPAV